MLEVNTLSPYSEKVIECILALQCHGVTLYVPIRRHGEELSHSFTSFLPLLLGGCILVYSL